MKKLIFGIIISAIFVYLSMRGVEYSQMLRGFQDSNYIFLIPAIILFLSLSFLRSLRWGVILSPLENIGQRKLFPITCIGYMTIALIPMRIGEVVRPYLLSTKSRIPLTSGLATIFVERVLDGITLLAILLFVILGSTVPDWLITVGQSFFITFIILVILMLFLRFRKDLAVRILSPLLNKLPKRITRGIETLIESFVEGFGIISDPTKLICAIFLSVVIWVFSALAIYFLYCFQGLQLPLFSAFVVLVVTVIGISLPTAPGFIGNFQFGCIMALLIFGVSKNDAFSFSMVYYLSGIGINILLGIVFLPFVRFSFKDIKSVWNHSLDPQKN